MFSFLLFASCCYAIQMSASLAEPLKVAALPDPVTTCRTEISHIPSITIIQTNTIPAHAGDTTTFYPIYNDTATLTNTAPAETAHGWNATAPCNGTATSINTIGTAYGWNTTARGWIVTAPYPIYNNTGATVTPTSVAWQDCWEFVPTGIFWPHPSGAFTPCENARPTGFNTSKAIIPSASASEKPISGALNGSASRPAGACFLALFVGVYLYM